MRQVRYVDLFCGMGSFHYSFDKLGFECVMACDIFKAARDNYKKNYELEPLEDICNIDPKNIVSYDILCAGFPCQPFSQAGKHKGFDDDRGTMFFQVMRFVKENKPSIVILENVRGLLTQNKGKSFEKVRTDLENEGYKVVWKLLSCNEYGIPQMRKRLFIIGFKGVQLKKELDKFFDLDDYKKDVSLGDFLDRNFEKKVAYTIRCGGRNSRINDKHNWDGYIVDGEEYRLTIDDCLKLQGFGEDYQLEGTMNDKWKLLGNTIPTIFTEIIGKQIVKFCQF